MSAVLSTPKTTSGGEIIRELVNASDGQGLHFDGAAGKVSNVAAPDLGTQWSIELIIQADAFGSANVNIADWSGSQRIYLGAHSATGYQLGFFRGTGFVSFGVDTLEDLKVHHLVVVVDETANTATLYDNGNQAASITPNGSSSVDTNDTFRLCSDDGGTANFFNGTLYRARLWNKGLTAPEVTATYENATVPFADQYGSQTNKIQHGDDIDTNWGLEVVDAAAFNAGYNWVTNGPPSAISVNASNVLTFTTATVYHGIYYPAVLAANKSYRVTLKTGAITGDGFKVFQYGGALIEIGTLAASTTNIFEFTAPANSNTNLLVYSSNADGDSGTGTIQLDGTSVANSIVEIGCVADYDLAFANPTQSLMVQDRAGAADGTSSATGVVQVTPIEQLNSKAISVSNATQRTPANGDIVADQIGVGIVPTVPLDISSGGMSVIIGADTDATTRTNSTRKRARLAFPHFTNAEEPIGGFYLDSVDATTSNVAIGGGSSSLNAATAIKFYTAANATTTTGTERLTIDSAGLATFSAGINLGNVASATATTLDGYKEGTFTVGVAGDSSGSLSGETGEYTRIGNVVFVRIVIRVDVNFTSEYISGLPYNCECASSASTWSQIGTALTSVSTNAPIVATAQDGSANVRFFNGANTNTLHSPNTTNDYYRIVGSYFTADAF